jgi:hypothetical protein
MNMGQLRNSQYFYGVGLKRWSLKMKIGAAEGWEEVKWQGPLDCELFGYYKKST